MTILSFSRFSHQKKIKKGREREREAISISAATFITEGARREGKTRREERREEEKRREKREEGRKVTQGASTPRRGCECVGGINWP